ncbi:MAG: hypothetical protein Kow0063_17910 [Anaerolineae bacterium]
MSPSVLIADDEAYVRLLIEQSLEELEDEGVELLTAEDGQEALATIQARKPDLVFLDVMMPRMNGFDVCYTVKRELELSQVHVVMLTARGQEFDRQRGEAVGVDGYMTKPFDPDELLARARAVLGIARHGESTSPGSVQ